jgi:methylmalonyl-CoA mutase
VDRGETVIVGVNKYRLENEAEHDTREVDNSAVRAAQIRRLEQVKRSRDSAAVRAALAALEGAALKGEGSLLGLAVDAARARATVGEISDAMRSAFGDHTAKPKVVQDIYAKAYSGDPEYGILTARLADFIQRTGAAPRLMVAKLGQDGHDRGAKVISSAFGDIGFEVIAGSLFQTPQEAATEAIAHQVQVIGVSSLAAGHKTLLPQLIETLREKGAADIIVICGGVIPRQDYQFLFDAGVAAVFGPGTNVLAAAKEVMDLVEGRGRNL